MLRFGSTTLHNSKKKERDEFMFAIDSVMEGEHPAFEYPGTMKANEAGTRGEVVKWDATGTLTLASGTDTPVFVLQADVEAAASPTVRPPVIRIMKNVAWRTSMGAVNSSPAAIALGSKLTIHTDGLTLSYVTTSGTAEVKALENTGNAVVGDELSVVF
jgi:hypothetical protein